MSRTARKRIYRRELIQGGLLGLGAAIAFESCSKFSLASAWGSMKEEGTAFHFRFPAMGSLLEVRWLDTVSSSKSDSEFLAKQIQSDAKRLAEHWNRVLSDYEEDSQAMQLARACDSGEWQSVESDLAAVLSRCDQWFRRSEGAFDCALGSISRLRRKRSLAKPIEWEQAKEAASWRWVEWNEVDSKIRFQRPGIRFDFGAIGKGWLADRLYDRLLRSGLECCLINFAGNMRMGKAPPETAGWPVVIDPCIPPMADKEPSPLCVLRLQECGIATSGDRFQKLVDSTSAERSDRSSHIIDPASGEGMKLVQSVTFIADDATDADAGSTATSVWQKRNIASWTERLDREPIKYRWILQNWKSNSLHLSSNAI